MHKIRAKNTQREGSHSNLRKECTAESRENVKEVQVSQEGIPVDTET
jgi:hypothetical protein